MEGLSPFAVHLELSQCCLLTGSGGDLIAQSCLTLATPQTVARQAPLSHGVSQARILEWVAPSSSRGSSHVSCIAGSLPHCRQILYRLSHQGSPMVQTEGHQMACF